MEITGRNNIKIVADKNISDINSKDYDAVYAPGGTEGAYKLRDNKKVIEIFKKMYKDGKIVSAICAAPIILDEADLIQNKNITSYPGIQNEFKSKNFNYKENPVVKDENILTGRGPAISFEMAFEIIEALLGKEKRKEVENKTLYTLLMNEK